MEMAAALQQHHSALIFLWGLHAKLLGENEVYKEPNSTVIVLIM